MTATKERQRSHENECIVEVYGSLLNEAEREELLSQGGRMEDAGDIERAGWKISFDRYSSKRGEPVLNFVKTKSTTDIFFTRAFKMDKRAFQAVAEREMGLQTLKKWRSGEKIDPNNYRPYPNESPIGCTTIFLIPQEGRLPQRSSKESTYVGIVRQGIENSFEGQKKKTNLLMLNRAIEESSPETIRLFNIVDMGLTFSAMIRLFEKGTKRTLQYEITNRLRRFFSAESAQNYLDVHSSFCDWGTKEIRLAKKKRGKMTLQEGSPASYGEIAKTFDVVLKVVVYYCQLPEPAKAQTMTKSLNAAVDTKMMAFLRKHYPNELERWPRTVKEVDKTDYDEIQRIVRKFIREKYRNKILPVQFDDIFWKELNR